MLPSVNFSSRVNNGRLTWSTAEQYVRIIRSKLPLNRQKKYLQCDWKSTRSIFCATTRYQGD